MRCLRTLILFDKGDLARSEDWNAVHDAYSRSIASIDFPRGSGKLTLKKKIQDADGQWRRNGVGYLKSSFLKNIVDVEGWEAEGDVEIANNGTRPEVRLFPSLELHDEGVVSQFGGFDLVTSGASGTKVAIEWETGNISSSHRSMNKLCIALSNGVIDVGVLIVPSKELYAHLTDRIGNIGELSPYIDLWAGLGKSVTKGLLAITVVEHDQLTDADDFPYLPRGNDGRARQGREKVGKARN